MRRPGSAVIQNPMNGYVASVVLVFAGIFSLIAFSSMNSQSGFQFDMTIPILFSLFAFVLAGITFLLAVRTSERLDEVGLPAEDRSIVDQLYVVQVGGDEHEPRKAAESSTSDARVQRLRDLRDSGVITSAEYDKRVRELFFNKDKGAAVSAPKNDAKKDVGARLDQLKALRDAGQITEEDYQKRKEEIVREI
jgi:hypothetical protein